MGAKIRGWSCALPRRAAAPAVKALVVGTDGLIGASLAECLRHAGHEVLGTTRRKKSDGLMLDLAKAEEFQVPPGVEIAFICAGIGSLVECAKSPDATGRVNVAGTACLARHLAERGSKVVYLSTNLVFDGCAPAAGISDPVKPCCEYGRQKAELESRLHGDDYACVRLTKVAESLASRFEHWQSELRQGKQIAVSEKLRFSPVSLEETVRALSEFACDFRPGVFHISGDEDFSYHEAALRLAHQLSLPAELIETDPTAGSNLFEPMPAFATLAVHGPDGSSCWRFSPSSVTLDNFTRRLAAN
ncbi:MAG: sugar nucleotide-binding protein [Chthoniobacterales bacterium]|nr:sugar nucleotide-binding protein [Chthoniobacterales bacterium]